MSINHKTESRSVNAVSLILINLDVINTSIQYVTQIYTVSPILSKSVAFTLIRPGIDAFIEAEGIE